MQTDEAREGCRAQLHPPVAAAKSPSPLEIARSICSQPVHLEIPAFAGEVPQCNCGASTCPEHRGCGATGLHYTHYSILVLPQALRCMSKAAHVGLPGPYRCCCSAHLPDSGTEMAAMGTSAAMKSHIKPSLGSASSQGHGASINLIFSSLLGSSETGFCLCGKAHTVRHG